jgi:hypothetical protein
VALAGNAEGGMDVPSFEDFECGFCVKKILVQKLFAGYGLVFFGQSESGNAKKKKRKASGCAFMRKRGAFSGREKNCGAVVFQRYTSIHSIFCI